MEMSENVEISQEIFLEMHVQEYGMTSLLDLVGKRNWNSVENLCGSGF